LEGVGRLVALREGRKAAAVSIRSTAAALGAL
jgi:hypothetical protein